MFRRIQDFSRFLLIIVLGAGFMADFSWAQDSPLDPKFVCSDVESRVLSAIPVTKVSTRDFRDDECDFYFHMGEEWFSVLIVRYETTDNCKKEFRHQFDYLTLEEAFPEYVKKIKRSRYWTQAKGYRDPNSDSLIMLRDKNVLITIIGSEYDFLFDTVEPLLRRINYPNPAK